MNLFFRLVRILFSALFLRKQTGLFDPHRIRSAVWLGDHDLLGHMTNSRYASFTDLAVMNYMGRTGALAMSRRKGWAPVIQHESLTYHKGMRFPQKFEVRTQLVGWSGPYLCFHHQFWSKKRLIADSRMIARFVARGRQRVTGEMVLEAMNQSAVQAPLERVFMDAIADLSSREAQAA